MIQSLTMLYKRDLQKLKSEIKNYNDEANLWITEKEISNSAGNLCLHIIGNLNHFIGATLGGTGYIRQRNTEFNINDVSRQELITKIDETNTMIKDVFESLNENELNKTYPINVFDEEMTTEYFLIHLFGHLNYHLGQINYHRRLLDIAK